MTCGRLRFLSAATGLLLPLLAAGCGHSDADGDFAAIEQTPARFDHAGRTWQQRNELTEAEAAALSRWFQQHPGLIGSAELEGDPCVYRADNGDGLFIWLTPGVDEARWVRLLHRRGTVTMDSGTGSPF